MKLTFIFFVFLISVIVISGCTKGPGKYDTFAQCLNEKGATMYGTEWCSHCKNQKALFGNSFQYIDYVDCDKNKNECLRNGVKGYPTWIIDGESYPGEQQLYKLASLAGCELAEDKK